MATGYTIKKEWRQEKDGWMYVVEAKVNDRFIAADTLQTFTQSPPDEKLSGVQEIMKRVEETCRKMADLVP